MLGLSRTVRLPVLRQVRNWASEVWQVGENDAVMVTELTCTEPGCPPLETCIAWLKSDGQSLKVTVHKPLHEVTQEDVHQACSTTQ